MDMANTMLKMQVVSRRTGIPRNTLVAWERRHGLVTPQRRANGYRVYTESQVQKLLRAKTLIEQGWAISDVATLFASEGGNSASDGIRAVREELLRSLLVYNSVVADRTMQRLLFVPFDDLLDEVICPLLVEVGTAWHEGTVSVAQEHFVSAWCRTQVLGMSQRLGAGPPEARRVICGGFPGERHEIGLLCVAVKLTLRGLCATSLGIEMPPQDLGLAVRGTGAAVVCQSLVMSRPTGVVQDHIDACRRYLPDETLLVLGGPGTADLGALDGAWICPGVEDLAARLRIIER
jgi:MerR family transcriptional regulator, light-induced transcriptional regulator